MIIDCTIHQVNDYIVIVDLTHKPKINEMNIQVFTPNDKIVNTSYHFKKVNVFGKNRLGELRDGKYVFNIGGCEKAIDLKTEIKFINTYQN